MKRLGKTNNKRRRRKLAAVIGTGAFVASLSPQLVSAADTLSAAPPKAAATQAPTRTFAIAAQPLADALLRFSQITGIHVVYDPDDLRGLVAHGVNGSMTPERALRALLDGTSVVYRFVDARTVRLTRVLAIAHVRSNAGAWGNLSKFTAPLLRTPQSVVTIPSEVLAQRNVSSLSDAMRNVSGISLSAGEGGAQGDAMTIRGFTSAGDIYLDGVRDFGEYYRDPFDLESIEVAEGPSSAMVGPGSAGGFINQVSKKPQLQPLASAVVTGETNDGERVTFDVDDPLGAHSAFRLDAMQNAANTADRDVTNVRRWGVAPSVEFGLGTSTRVLLAFEHLTEHDIPDYGIPYLWGAPAPVARQSYYGLADDVFDESSNIATATIEHDFNASLTLRNVTRSSSYDRTFRSATASIVGTPPPDTPLDQIDVTRSLHAENGDDDFFDNQTDLIGKAHTGSIAHVYDLGVEIGDESGHDIRPKYANLPSTTLVDPDVNQTLSGTTETISSDSHVSANTFGLYALDSMQLAPRWELNGGVRWDDFQAQDRESVTDTNADQQADALTGHAGVVYEAARNGTIYASYATSFDPAVDDLVLTQAGSLVPPEFDQSYELGSKWEFGADDGLSLSGALFHERSDNVALSEESYTSTAVLVGNEVVDGVQLQADGRITKRWSLHAGYTLLEGTILEANQAGAAGNQLVNVPRDSAALWSTYDLPDRWQVGIGADGLTARYARPSPSASTGGVVPDVPGYWRIDAMVKAPLANSLDAQLNLYNLTDKEYYDAVYTDHVVPGAGFTAAFSLVEKFK